MRNGLCYALTAWIFYILLPTAGLSQGTRVRDAGIRIGVMDPGEYNAITDVPGVMVGHQTLVRGDSIRTGVTAILPYGGNIFRSKVPAAVHIGNGFGKLTGISQVKELGNLETPVVLTNTLSVPVAANALISFTLDFEENADVRSVNPVVGETNDGFLNDIRGRHITEKDVILAIRNARTGRVEEGNVGAGTGTICFGFKGGIGTASRVLPARRGGYTVGVLVQTNFGGVLRIGGLDIAEELEKTRGEAGPAGSIDGSCMIIVATDAPLDARNLERLAMRAMLGLGRTGGISSNGSGDYVIAFSTAPGLRVPYQPVSPLTTTEILLNDMVTPLFTAVIEATEEAILNSLFMAETITGYRGRTVQALPVKEVLKILEEKGMLPEE